MTQKIVAIVGLLGALIGFAFPQDDLVWFSLTPGGPPVEVLDVSPDDTVTLWLVLFNNSLSASAIHFPVRYDSLIEVVDYDFDYDAFNFLGYCSDYYNFFDMHDPDSMVVFWFAYTVVYPTCDIPVDSWHSAGWIRFRLLGEEAHLSAGAHPITHAPPYLSM